MDGTLATKKLADNIWTFNEAVETTGPQVDAYLITGTNRAVLIDTLLEETSLYSAVRAITALPLDVLITHGHPDHAGAATKSFYNAGCDVYIGAKDIPLLSKNNPMQANSFKLLEEGMVFDLGGYKLETIFAPGHTPDSAVFLEREKQHLYTGDAIGAGVFWMQVPTSLSLNKLLESLKALEGIVDGMDNLLIHPGHRHQAPIQLKKDFLTDTVFATEQIISSRWIGEDKTMTLGGMGEIKYKTISYKLITDYCYNPDKIK